MEGVMPWPVLLSHIESHYLKLDSGASSRWCWRACFASLHAVRIGSIYLTGKWKIALYEIEIMRHFAGFFGITDTLLDETTIMNFRHLLEKPMYCLKQSMLTLRLGLLVSKGTMVDVTISFMHQIQPRIANRRVILRCTRRRRENNVLWHEGTC